MTSMLRHRGPDGEGYFNDGVASLGHRRLAIIDIAGGDQPMANETNDVWVVFNGEIYNHRTLREFLTARGHRFRTKCDTEVIVHAYEEFGTECVARVDGIHVQQYWDVTEFDTDTRSDAAIVEDVNSHLRDAVSRRMESEVPLGAFLSGGIDSGLVVSYMAEIAGAQPTTISVGFQDSA